MLGANLKGGTGATNVIPGRASAQFNLRFCPDNNAEKLKKQINQICTQHADNHEIDWSPIGLPYQTSPGELLEAVQSATVMVTDRSAKLSTDGGKSDGRFIAPTGAQVVELGPLNKTIHQVNEAVNAKDLDALSDIYEQTLIRLLA